MTLLGLDTEFIALPMAKNSVHEDRTWQEVKNRYWWYVT